MTATTPRIGILGGLGALASAEFHRRLIQRWSQLRPSHDDRDFPEVLHLSAALPGLTLMGLDHPGRALDALRPRLTLMNTWGAHVVALPCNSLLPLGAALQAQTDALVLTPWTSWTGWAGTGPTVVLGSNTFAKSLGRNDDASQRDVDTVIAMVVAGQLDDAARLLQCVTDWLKLGPTDSLLLACTELSALNTVRPLRATCRVVDTLDTLVERTIAAARTAGSRERQTVPPVESVLPFSRCSS